MNLNTKIVSDKHLSFLAVLMAVEAARSREAEASVMVNNPGVMKIYDTNKAPNERIKIVADADHGELMIDQRSGEIKYSPDQLGMPDTFEYDLVSDGMCANFLMCPPMLVLIAAVAGGISRYRDKLECPEAKGVDFGDAPDSFQTVLASDGARHAIVPGVILGRDVDKNQDGLPTETADGDDEFDGNDDENGLIFSDNVYGFGEDIPMELIIGGTGSGYVTIWADFNFNGVFDEDEVIEWEDGPLLFNYPVAAGYSGEGIFHIHVPTSEEEPGVPYTESSINLYIRARVANDAVVDLPYGLINSGEVEDYLLTIVARYDFGDLPLVDVTDMPEDDFLESENLDIDDSGAWFTLLDDDGAAHLLNGTLRLGSDVDADDDGVPSIYADGDDISDGNDDEDGVTFFNRFSGEGQVWGQVPQKLQVGNDLNVEAQEIYDNWVEVDIQGEHSGYLNGWIDFNGNYIFDREEQIFANEYVEPGDIETYYFNFTDYDFDSIYSRFRVSDKEISSPNGVAIGGEVEDYSTELLQLDFGDLPYEPFNMYSEFDYPEAYHMIVDGVYLGEGVDSDPNTLGPRYNYNTADGDDESGFDDDDGVWFNPELRLEVEALNGYAHSHGLINMGTTNEIQVEVGPAGGYVYAWLDEDLNGSFENDELIINTPTPLSPGTHSFFVYVDNNYDSDDYMYSRFRITSEQQNDPSPDGFYESGEVEDYSTDFYGFE